MKFRQLDIDANSVLKICK